MIKLLTERDAARILNISVHWLRRQRWLGEGPPYVKCGRAVRYEEAALVLWIESNRRGDGPPRLPMSR
jgi:hypothetical protein